MRSAPTAAKVGYKGARFGVSAVSAANRAQKGKNVNTEQLGKNAKSFGSSTAKLSKHGFRFLSGELERAARAGQRF